MLRNWRGAGHVGRMGHEHWQIKQTSRKWKRHGDEDGRNCDGGLH